jgi:hypothetical protein
VEQELPTLAEHLSSPPVLSGVRVTCRSLFLLLFFFSWSLCFLFFFDIWILITPLVSSNSSCLLATLHRPLNSTIYCFYHINLWGFLEPNRDFQCGTCTKKGTHLQTLILHIPFNRSHSTCNLHVLYYTNCMKSSTFLDS